MICYCTTLGPKFSGVYWPIKFQSAFKLGPNEQQDEWDKKNAMDAFNYVINFTFHMPFNDITVANRQWVRSAAHQSVIPILHVY